MLLYLLSLAAASVSAGPLRRSTPAVSVPLIENAPGGLPDYYYVAVDIGTPPQHFRCVFDAGSYELVVPTNCLSSNCADLPQYLPDQSSTFVNTTRNASFTYISGPLSGYYVTDVVTLGGISIINQTIVAANNIPVFNEENGLQNTLPCNMGAGYGSYTNISDNFFRNVVTKSGFAEPIAGVYLGSASYLSNETLTPNQTAILSSAYGGSELILGGVNSSKIDGAFTSTKQFNQHFQDWLLHFDGIAINGVIINGTNGTGPFDTGTVFTYGPLSWSNVVADAIGPYTMSQVVQPAEYADISYTVPCTYRNASLPTVGLAINGTIFEIAPTDLIVPKINSTDCELGFRGENATIQGTDDATWNIGLTFLRNVYIQFDYSNNGSVAFAKLSAQANDTVAPVSVSLNATQP